MKNKNKELLLFFILLFFFIVTFIDANAKDVRIVSNTLLSTNTTTTTTIATGADGTGGISNLTGLYNTDNYVLINVTGNPDNNRSLIVNLSNNVIKWLYNQSSIWGYNQSDGNSGGSFSNAISNLTAIISTDGNIVITADSDPRNNRTLNLTLPNSVKQWLYNQSDNSQLIFNYNQTYSGSTFNSTYDKFAYNQSLSDAYNYSLASQNQFVIYWNNQTASMFTSFVQFWRNNTLDLLGMFNTWTAPQTFNANITIKGNTTLQNLTITDLKTCTLKTDSNGVTYCGTDNTAAGSFSNAVSNLTAIVNNDGYLLINITGATSGINNQTLIINLSNNVIKWLYNQSDNSQLIFNYNETSAVITIANVFTDSNTFNRNVTILGNLTVGNVTIRTLTQNSCDVKATTSGNIYCGTDATTAGSFSNAYSNLTGLSSTDGRIIVTADSDPNNNKTLNLTLNSNVPYNVTFNNYVPYNDTFRYNQTSPVLAIPNLCLLNNTQTYTASQTFGNITINGNATINGNLTTRNITITDLKTCTLKTDANGVTYCGTDNTAASSFSNAISNLTGLYNNDTYILINTTGTSNGINNQSLLLALSSTAVKWFYNHSSIWNYNQSDGKPDYTNLAYLNNSETFTATQTFGNATINGNFTVRGNTTLRNLTITDLLTCTLKSDSNGVVYCGVDNSAAGSFSNAISNLTALVNTDGYLLINITGTSGGINNQTLIINLSQNVIKFLYNMSDNNQLIFNYNHTSAIVTIANIFTQPQSFNQNVTIGGNLTVDNVTIRNLVQSSCDLKATTSGNVYCGTDATSTGSFSNAVSNLTGLSNTDNYLLINITGASGGINNQSLIINFSLNTIKWLYNHTSIWGYNFTGLEFNYTNGTIKTLEAQYKTFWINQTKAIQDNYATQWYNHTAAIVTVSNTFIPLQTFNGNVSIVGGNLTINGGRNNGITFAGGNTTQGWNGTCFIIQVVTLRDEWCPI